MEEPGNEIEAMDEENSCILSALFHVSGIKFQVSLNQKFLKWEPLQDSNSAKSASKNSKLKQGCIPLKEVISARTKAPKKNAKTGVKDILEVSYCEKFPDKLWKLRTIDFVAEGDSGNAEAWTQEINQALQSPESGTTRPKKLLVLINPVGGWKKGEKIYKDKVAPLFRLAGIETEVIATTHSNHASEVVQGRDITSVDGIVAVGGDGTFRELVDGAIKNVTKDDLDKIDDINFEIKKPPVLFGLIPSGTGNGLIVAMTGTKDPVTAALHIATGQTNIPMNVSTVHCAGKFHMYSTLLQGAGFFAETIKISETRRWMGPLRYPYCMLKGIASWNNHTVEIEYIPVDSSTNNANGIQESQENVQESLEQVELGWVKEKILMKGIMVIAYDLKTIYNRKANFEGPARSFMLIINSTCPRSDLVKFFKRSLDDEPVYDDLDIRVIECIQYKMKWDHQKKSESEPVFFNLDGDICEIPEPEIHVRVLQGLIKTYGGGPMGSKKKKVPTATLR